MIFDVAFEKLIGHEGAYSNHPNDPGGETMFGVTVGVARAAGYTGPMRDLPIAKAKEIYRATYWDTVRADELPPACRYHIFDACVNSGPSQAVKWLQRAVGVTDDGKIGAVTVYAARAAPPDALIRRMLSQRLRFMTELKNWHSFSRGWSKRIADLLET